MEIIMGKYKNEFFTVDELKVNDILFANTILNNSQDTIYFKDLNSTFILSSKAHASLFGVENPKEVIGKNDFDYFPEYFAKDAYKDEQNIIATGVPIIGRIEKLVRPDGSVTWLSASKYPLYDSKGEIVGTWGTSRDITLLKNAEEELKNLNSQLEEANRQLTILSAIDSLSGLYNHRQFYEKIDNAYNLYTRQKEKGCYSNFSIILFDIDDFKNINDTYGHLMGDFAIRHVAEIMIDNTRSIDSCFRYGGDEFAILLFDPDLGGAKNVAEKIRKKIEKASISSKHPELRLTVSIGISSFNEGEKAAEIIKKADERLYQSKNKGKNMIS